MENAQMSSAIMFVILIAVIIVMGAFIAFLIVRNKKRNKVVDYNDYSSEDSSGNFSEDSSKLKYALEDLKIKIEELEAVNTDLSKQNASLSKQNADLKGLIEKYEKPTGMLRQLIESFPDFNMKGKEKMSASDQLEEYSELLIKYFDDYLLKLPKLSDEKRESFKNFVRYQRYGCDALTLIIRLKKLMGKFQVNLQNQETSISQDAAKCNLDNMLDIAMICFDNITMFHDVNQRREQEINVKLLVDKNFSREEALDQAKVMTNNITETPKWIVILKETLDKNGITKSRTIFTGYKLNNK